jgi:hypothetical protein
MGIVQQAARAQAARARGEEVLGEGWGGTGSAWQLLPAVHQLFPERLEYFYHALWELPHVLLCSLGYKDDLADEGRSRPQWRAA